MNLRGGSAALRGSAAGMAVQLFCAPLFDILRTPRVVPFFDIERTLAASMENQAKLTTREFLSLVLLRLPLPDAARDEARKFLNLESFTLIQTGF